MGLPLPPYTPPEGRIWPYTSTPGTDALNVVWGDLHNWITGAARDHINAAQTIHWTAGGIG